MIRVTVEVIPFGDEDQAREIGRVEIVNTRTTAWNTGRYVVEASGEIGERDVVTWHPRAEGALELLHRAFHALRTPTDSDMEDEG